MRGNLTLSSEVMRGNLTLLEVMRGNLTLLEVMTGNVTLLSEVMRGPHLVV